MLTGYESDSEDAAAAEQDEDTDEERSQLPDFARKPEEPAEESAAEPKEPFAEAIEEAADAGADDVGAAGGEIGPQDNGPFLEEEEAQEEDEEDDNSSCESEDPAFQQNKPLPSAGQAFKMVDQTALQKFKPARKVVVEAFKKKPTRRPAPGSLIGRPQPGTIFAPMMQAGLRRVVQREDAAPTEEVDSELVMERKKAALQAMGLIEGGDAPAAGKGTKRKGQAPPGADEAWQQEKVAIDQVSAPLRRAGDEDGEGTGRKRMPKGHILGLASEELERQRKEGQSS